MHGFPRLIHFPLLVLHDSTSTHHDQYLSSLSSIIYLHLHSSTTIYTRHRMHPVKKSIHTSRFLDCERKRLGASVLFDDALHPFCSSFLSPHRLCFTVSFAELLALLGWSSTCFHRDLLLGFVFILSLCLGSFHFNHFHLFSVT
jgi:hypothetical protein